MKYNLDKTYSKCPKCGSEKNRFRSYGTMKSSSLIGYCSECGHYLSPFEYENIQRMLLAEYSDSRDQYNLHNKSNESEQEELPWVLKPEYITQSLSYNTLIVYLKTTFGDNKYKDIMLTAARYGLETQKNPGHKWHGAPVFYQFDLDYRKISYKIMQYNDKGHRVKGKDYANSTYREDRIDRAVPEIKSYNLDIPKDLLNQQSLIKKGKYCLFGLHLLNHPDVVKKKICIVESEKTAIICSMFYPEGLWLAAGSCYYLREEKMNDIYNLKIKPKNIVLFPDTDVYGDKPDDTLGASDWYQMVNDCKWLKGVCVSLFTLNLYAPKSNGKYGKDRDGHDLADYIIETYDSDKKNNGLALFEEIIK